MRTVAQDVAEDDRMAALTGDEPHTVQHRVTGGNQSGRKHAFAFSKRCGSLFDHRVQGADGYTSKGDRG